MLSQTGLTKDWCYLLRSIGIRTYYRYTVDQGAAAMNECSLYARVQYLQRANADVLMYVVAFCLYRQTAAAC